MRKFTNPLDNIRIASPCTSNWDEMFGGDRKRFCAQCKLNVYNLSDMTRREAENLLVDSEGRLCVRFFRRADGTLITQDCPVGWRALKGRATHAATALLSMIMGFVSGVFAFRAAESFVSLSPLGDVAQPVSNFKAGEFEEMMRGAVVVETKPGRKEPNAAEVVVGQIANIEKMNKKKVAVWVK